MIEKAKNQLHRVQLDMQKVLIKKNVEKFELE